MSLGALLAIVGIQLATVLLPLAVGLTGLISGGMAGLASIAAWFLLGIPLSYSIVDARAARRTRTASPRKQLTPARL